MSVEWNHKDKQNLLFALHKYGPTNLQAIGNELPTKSISDIRVMIMRYERRACHDSNEDSVLDSCTDQWIEILRRHTDYNELSPVAKALKYIALFEERSDTGIDLQGCYELLANAAVGSASKSLDEETKLFFIKTLFDTAKETKKENDKEISDFLKKINLTQRTTNMYGRKKVDDTCLFNPLKVPDELYKKKKT